MSILRRPSVPLGYAFAALAVALVFELKVLLDPLFPTENPFLLFFAPILISAWRGGLGPGLLATALAALTSDWFFLPPTGSILGADTPQNLRLALFVLEGTLMSALAAAVRAARLRSERVSRELWASEERYRRMVDTASEGIWTTDADARVNYVNRRMAELLGYEPEEVLGRHVFEFMGDVARIEASKSLERQRQGTEERQVFRFRRKDGSEFWASLSTSPFFGKEGEYRGSIAMVADVTKRRLAEEALRESEYRFRTMADTAPVMIRSAGPDKLSDYFNLPWLEFTGRALEAELGYGWTASVHPEDVERCLATYHDSFDMRRPFRMEYRLRRADGEYRWVLETGVPRFTPGGQFQGYIGSCIDITERKLAEEAHARLLAREQAARADAETAERRSTFLAAASEALAASLDAEATLGTVAQLAVPHVADWCVVDLIVPEGLRRVAVAHVVASAAESPGKAVPRRDLRAPFGPPASLRTGRPDFHPEVTPSVLAALASGRDRLAALRRAGLTSYLSVPLRARARTLGALTFATIGGRRLGRSDFDLAEDLARRGALAIENARLYAELQEANRAKDEFLTTVSHELRTPLTAMLGWAQLLRKETAEPGTLARGLELIETSAKLQAQLVEDLLDISRIVTGRLRLEVTPLQLAPVIDAAIDSLCPAAEAKGIEVRRAIDPSAGAVLGDAERLQQVLWNLLSNSIKFTPRQGRVDVRLEAAGAHVRVVVADTGEGIAPGFLPYVFERFRQEDSSSTRAHGGLGVGLAIVRHLVELHGGTVRAESSGRGRGATFIVTFPVAATHVAPAAAVPQASSEETPDSADASDAARLAGVTVLLVDDDPAARELLATICERAGARVTPAASVAEALAALERELPDVVVSDLAMPGQDGYMLLDELESRLGREGARIPAVALTADADSAQRRQAVELGFQLQLSKSSEAREIVAAIARVARGR